MKENINKTKNYLLAHKIISGIILIIIIISGYYGYKKIKSTTGENLYITTKIEKGTIISTISASGQVSSLNSIDLKSKVNNTITYVGVEAGDQVQKGKLLFSIDSTDAQKNIRDAQINLQNAKISLEKLNIKNSNENMNATLAQSYDDGFNTVSNVFLDLPGIMSGFNDMFFKTSNTLNGQWYINWYQGQVAGEDADKATLLKQGVIDSYNLALNSYNISFDKYKTISRNDDSAIIEALVQSTYDTTRLIADMIKNANNYLDFVNNSMQMHNFNIPTIITTHKATLNTYTSKTNSGLSTLISTKNNIKNNKDAFPNANLDLQSSQISVTQKENALQDAKNALADYYIRAPFSGTISSVLAKVGDTVSGTLGTIITDNKMATISLNEVDVAKIQLGQKATLTFDAIPNLTITGKVAQIDSVGTVSQGVVNYNIKISFDTDDIRIKPGMSVSVNIITNIKQDVLVLTNNSIKTQNGQSYVETFQTELSSPVAGSIGSTSITPPQKTIVETGLSNNTETEIISGLKEGDIVVTKTITATTTSKNTAPSILNSIGGNKTSGSGNAIRAIRPN